MHDAFMDDICANIDDDTPRLVYADWLSENGEEERAEFIRTQVAAHRLPYGEERRALEVRVFASRDKHWDEWFSGLNLGDAAADALCRSALDPYWINVRDNSFTPTARSRLRDRFGRRPETWDDHNF